jgi:uncharacterized protein YecE (DUF72 family)
MGFLNQREAKPKAKERQLKKVEVQAIEPSQVALRFTPKESKSHTVGVTLQALHWAKPLLLKQSRLRDEYEAYAKYYHALEISCVFPQLPGPELLKPLFASTIEEFVIRLEFERDIHLQALATHDGMKHLLALLSKVSSARYTLVLGLSREIKFDDISCEALDAFISQLDGIVIAIEAEHWSWGREESFINIVSGLRAVVHHDTPKLPGLTARKGAPQMHHKKVQRVITRLQGRNLESWLQHDADRFAYAYTTQDIREVKSRIDSVSAGRKIVIASHLPHEQAFRTAEMFVA